MKKEFIMTDCEKLARKTKIELNKEKLMRKMYKDHSRENPTSSTRESSSSSDSNSDSVASASDLQPSSSSGPSLFVPSSKGGIKGGIKGGMDVWLQLSYVERVKLEQLLAAHAAMEPASRDDFFIDQDLLDVLKFTDYFIRNIIKMAKKLPAFRDLCQEDQIALLKGACMEIVILRSAMSLNLDTECWENVVCMKVLEVEQLMLGSVACRKFSKLNNFCLKISIDRS